MASAMVNRFLGDSFLTQSVHALAQVEAGPEAFVQVLDAVSESTVCPPLEYTEMSAAVREGTVDIADLLIAAAVIAHTTGRQELFPSYVAATTAARDIIRISKDDDLLSEDKFEKAEPHRQTFEKNKEAAGEYIGVLQVVKGFESRMTEEFKEVNGKPDIAKIEELFDETDRMPVHPAVRCMVAATENQYLNQKGIGVRAERLVRYMVRSAKNYASAY